MIQSKNWPVDEQSTARKSFPDGTPRQGRTVVIARFMMASANVPEYKPGSNGIRALFIFPVCDDEFQLVESGGAMV
jgi:hypothetical protein